MLTSTGSRATRFDEILEYFNIPDQILQFILNPSFETHWPEIVVNRKLLCLIRLLG